MPAYETSSAAPFDRWPTGQGFERFYGFVGGETHQYYPALYEGTTPIEPDRTPEQGYHFTEDMTDKCIGWISQQKALLPDKPFFVYFRAGATPRHVPNEWSDKYRGKFSMGWDKLREQTFAKQKELGIVPQDCALTPRHKEIAAWHEMPADLKPVLERQMEVYAGFLEHTDHHVGRIVDALEQAEILDDTLIYYIVGDNGASAEGTLNGTRACSRRRCTGCPCSIRSTTPPRPSATPRSTLRSSATAASTTKAGWRAPNTRRLGKPNPTARSSTTSGNCYDTTTDWSEAKNVAKENPGKLEELKTLFLLEADKYLVTPLDDRKAERFIAELVGRPELISGNTQFFASGMKRLSENSVIVIKNKSHAVTANIEVLEGTKAEGTLIAQGGKFGGSALYTKSGKPKYCYNYMAQKLFYVEGAEEIPPGQQQVRMEFSYDGGGLGKGGTAALYLDGRKVGEARVDATAQGTFSLDETTDVGEETGTTVAEDVTIENSRFNGRIRFVQIDIGIDKDHFLSPEERFHIAMARQ